ncbi:Amuc_1102 family pilus-like protein [Rubritalea tangerina]|uniref:Amuc_1102 family pilus-like protein n=2 Tax=Rubritalea tangerina TaxID=430798 RepID=A0ABW4ZES9_9BACT
MKKSKLKMLCSTALVAALSMAAPLYGQAGNAEASDPKFDTLQSPVVGGNTERKSWKPKDWLEAEVKFKVEMPKTYRQSFVDSVTVKWYVAVKPEGSRDVYILEKEVEHVNVPVGEDVYSSVYLSPSAIKRISGSDRASKGVIEAIGGEVIVNGTTRESNKKRYFAYGEKVGWWTKTKASRLDRVPLLNKNETPFKFLWWDRYAEIKPERR